MLGNPVAHSQSPFIHAEFARQTGQTIEYTRVLCAMDGFAEAVRAFAASGARGCNVTVPFKFQSSALATQVTPRAALAQAANVLRFDADGWLADNTDGIGLVRDLQRNAGMALHGRRVLLIGAGGAAAGVLGPLIEARPALLHVANRTAEKAQALVRRHAALAGAARRGAVVQRPGRRRRGLRRGAQQQRQQPGRRGRTGADAVLRPGALAVDLMYGAAARPFLAWAERLGAVPRDGLGMLVEQAAEAFFLWRR